MKLSPIYSLSGLCPEDNHFRRQIRVFCQKWNTSIGNFPPEVFLAGEVPKIKVFVFDADSKNAGDKKYSVRRGSQKVKVLVFDAESEIKRPAKFPSRGAVPKKRKSQFSMLTPKM